MEFRTTANLVWDIKAESIEDAKNISSDLLNRMIGEKPIKRTFSVSEIVNKKLKRLGIFRLEEVFPFLMISGERQEFRVNGKIYLVKMNSHRLHIFSKNQKCVSCDLTGTIMALELSHGADHPHFNLYALDGGEEVLMTKDHIEPIAQGGKDKYENYQVMCSICNNIKADATLTLDAVKELRQIYNANVHRLTQSQMASLMKEEKSKRDTSGRSLLVPSGSVGSETPI